MTDKVQKIKEWISKEQDGLMDAQGNFEYPEHEGAYHILCNLDAYIDSLQEEPVSEDLERAANEWNAKASFNPFYMILDDNGNPYEVKQDYTTHAESFKAGAKWQKEQLMKDAMDGWIFRDIKEGKLRISDNKECWNGIRISEKSIEKSYLFCTTDDAIKVKLVIIKED